MENGLYLYRVRGGRGVLRIAWIRHKRGDWWVAQPGAMTIYRTNGDLTPAGVLAARGPSLTIG